VESYGAAIKRRQPEGPYHLAGHSFGGCIALELARWLEARGDTVSLVALDSFLDDLGAEALPDGLDDRALADWLERSVPGGALPGLATVLAAQLEAQRRYRPSGRIRGPVTLLYAEEGMMTGDRLASVLARWESVAEQPVRCLAVPGGHHSMLSGANAGVLVERLLERLGQPAAAAEAEAL
jgi:thioesterase domain-containing protein